MRPQARTRGEPSCPRRRLLFRSGIKIAVIGGGPAGLRAAEVAVAGGADVTLFDAKRSVGRKFLVAGRGGLNLTHSEPRDAFATRYGGPGTPDGFWPALLAGFDADALRAWAAGLGIETFVGTSGRVFPREFKAAPLLRRWVERLRGQGVRFAVRHRWIGLRPGAQWILEFEYEGGKSSFECDAVVLALGGGSWPETGSDGGWVALFRTLGVGVAPLVAANCGWEVDWPAGFVAAAEGHALKNVVVSAGGKTMAGELMVTRHGLEGGAIYQLGPELRAMTAPAISIDLKPTFTAAQLVARLGPLRGNFLAESRGRWRLGVAAHALLSHVAPSEAHASAAALAAAAKDFRVRLVRPRPIAEAISSAGGVRWDEIDAALMLRRLPGVFVAGEMIAWEAPTGGYLMQGCFATGTRAAESALRGAPPRNGGMP